MTTQIPEWVMTATEWAIQRAGGPDKLYQKMTADKKNLIGIMVDMGNEFNSRYEIHLTKTTTGIDVVIHDVYNHIKEPLRQTGSTPRYLDEAFNSGDGSYRP